MKRSTLFALPLWGLLFGLMIIGCKQDSLVGPQSTATGTKQPDFIKLPKHLDAVPLSKVVGDTALITPEHGGELKLEFKYKYLASDAQTRELNVKMRLKFPPHAVTDSIAANMRVDDQVLRSNVDITFNPHGSVFLKPAILDCEVRGMDVRDFTPTDEVWLYYDDNGTWVKMTAKKIEFNYNEGKIKCDDGLLHHFSRYAFGR